MLNRWMGISLVLLATLAQADIYKWTDNNGTVRYSDVPPNNRPYKSITTKKIPSAPPQAQSDNPNEAPPSQFPDQEEQINKEIAAQRRRDDAERLRMEEQNKASEDKARQQNCQTAKANLMNYQQGGRIYKLNAEGEREYLDDDALEKAAAAAQKEVDKYCR